MYIICVSVVLATIFVPFGAVLETVISIPFWSPSLAIILIAMIFMMYIWMHLTFPYTMTHIFGHAPWRNHITESMWLDKTCTPQEPFDMQRTVQWIKTVPKFQRKCKGMVVLYSIDHVDSLWCMWELACWCKSRLDSEDKGAFDTLVFLGLNWGSEKRLTSAEKKMFSEFDVRNSINRCFNPSDSMYLQNFIINGDEDTPGWGSLDNFNHFVRYSLPPIVSKCKRNYAKHDWKTAEDTINFLFG